MRGAINSLVAGEEYPNLNFKKNLFSTDVVVKKAQPDQI
jgi:hypothetical protein